MIDERARELERQAKRGDPAALLALQRSRQRTGCSGIVHTEHLNDDETRVANAHDAMAARDPNILALWKRCELCGKQVKISGRPT